MKSRVLFLNTEHMMYLYSFFGSCLCNRQEKEKQIKNISNCMPGLEKRSSSHGALQGYTVEEGM